VLCVWEHFIHIHFKKKKKNSKKGKINLNYFFYSFYKTSSVRRKTKRRIIIIIIIIIMEYFSFIFVLFEVTVTKWFKVHTIVLCSSRDLPHPLLPSSSFQLFSLHGKVSCCFTIDDEVAAFVERGEHNSFRTGLDRRYLGSCRDSILLQLKNWSMVSLALFAEGGI